MSENKKMNGEELEKVAGGTSGNDDSANSKPDLFPNLFPSKTVKCKICGKEYQEYDGDMGIRYTDKDLHYLGMCPECVETHPYKRSTERFIEKLPKK